MTDTIPATVKTPAHTPLPWKHQTDFQNVYALSDGDVGLTIHIAKTNAAQVEGGYAEAEANAAFIVRACNSHYQLVESLREAIEELWDRDHSSMDRIQFERANASLFTALSQAGGE